MRRVIVVIMLASVLNGRSTAVELTLGSDAPSGGPLMMQPGSTSGAMLITVVSDSVAVDANEFMSGWQTTFTIVPDPGTLGTLSFNSAVQPSPYVFDGISTMGLNSVISTTTTVGDTLLAFDFNFPFTGGVAVPASAPSNLLQTELAASTDAAGTFGVFAVDTTGRTEWTDASASSQRAHSFVNVPAGGGLVRIGEVSVSAPMPALQAGDADVDLDFDQFDIVKVSQGAKYLTGQAATWGEGDWDGAPGGTPSAPPSGNGRFDQFDVIAALATGNYLSGPYAAVQTAGQLNDTSASIVYDASTGSLAVDPPSGAQFTSVNIESAGGLFTGETAANLGGSFDIDADNHIFKATIGSSFGSLSFGNVAQPGLAEATLLSDLSVIGSLAGGGGIGDVDLVYIPIPEPASVILLSLGLIALMIQRRR